MSAGTDIAAEVRAALIEAATATGAGQLVGTVIRRGALIGPAYNPTYAADTLHSCVVIVRGYTAREREGTSIAATDLRVLASVLDINPTAADRLQVAGVTYEIVDAMPLQPGGVVLMWTLQVRE